MNPSIVIVDAIALRSVDQLLAAPRNARTHSRQQIAQIAKSIAEFGFVNPILVDPDGVIIAGHGRLEAARHLHMPQVPVIVLTHLTSAQRRCLALADNRIPLGAGWDELLLRLELLQLRDESMALDLTAFDRDELDRLMALDPSTSALTDEDAVPAAPTIPVSIRGDRWILGPHRLMCGDATIGGDVDALMETETADLIFTDPPYNVSYVGHTADHLTIENDHMTGEAFQQFLNAAFTSYRRIVKAGASLYIFHSSSWQREFQNALEQAGFCIRCQIIWVKNTFAWGHARYKFQHEPIFYAHVAGDTDPWFGNKSQSTVWQENKPLANRLHPTAKPVELVDRALLNSSRTGDVVVDLFGGSGSTLVGCERRARKARLMELDPKYADVIIQRWQDYTGQQARLADQDRTFGEVAQQRRNQAVTPTPGETHV